MLKKKHSTSKHLPRGLEILYEDRDILVVDKPAGLLTVGTETNKFRTAYYILTDYVRKGCLKSRNRIFIVHRLDQWTSGVLIFAKSEEVKLHLQAQWKDTEKKYLAVVYGQLAKKRELLPHTWLRTRLMSSIPQLTSQKANWHILLIRCLKRPSSLVCWRLIF